MSTFTRLRKKLFLASLLSAAYLFAPGARAQQAAAQAAPPPSASAEPARTADLEKRVRELEELVRKMAAERTQDAGAVPGVAGAVVNDATALERHEAIPAGAGGYVLPAEGGSRGDSPLAGWDDKRGFFMRSADEKFKLRITGQIQGDYRAFLDPEDTTDINSFLVRRARLGIEANMFEFYEFRLLPDFSNGQSKTAPASTKIQDAYLNIHYWDAFQIEAGQFEQPCSYEQLIQDRFVPTMERSLIDQLTPARDVGLMVHGQKLFGGRLDYAFAISNGETNGDFDQEKRKDLAGRIAVRPFDCPELWKGVRGLQVGISGTLGIEEEAIIPGTLRTPGTVPFFKFGSSVVADGLRSRWSPEVAYFNGPLGFAAQYLRQDQRMRPAATGAASSFLLDVPFKGGYALATLLLTGEERTTYSEAIAPLNPFDPCHPLTSPGAWELVARWSRLELGDEVFAPLRVSRSSTVRLADPKMYSSAATELTLGFNWYLNKWVRMQFNWEHAWFDDAVRLAPGPAGLLNHQDTLLTRLQVIF